MHQLHRRRGLYLLRTILVQNNDDVEQQHQQLQLWNKYVACFEVFRNGTRTALD